MLKNSGLKAVALAIITLATLGNSNAQETPATPLTTPGISGVVNPGTKVELIKEGFIGTEGPITLPDGSLIFTETQANRITRIANDGSTSTYIDNSNGSNGLAFSSTGTLYSVQVLNPRVGIIYPPEKAKTLAETLKVNHSGDPTILSSINWAAFISPTRVQESNQGSLYPTPISQRYITSRPKAI